MAAMTLQDIADRIEIDDLLTLHELQPAPNRVIIAKR